MKNTTQLVVPNKILGCLFLACLAEAGELKKVSFHLKASLLGQPLLQLTKGTIGEVNNLAATRTDQVMMVL